VNALAGCALPVKLAVASFDGRTVLKLGINNAASISLRFHIVISRLDSRTAAAATHSQGSK
jgi:hypothetical protein